MDRDNIYTCPGCGRVNKAALEYFREQGAMLKQIQQELALPDVSMTFFATQNGTHFHRPECVWIEDIPPEKLTGFYSHEEAVEADYKPCKTCRA